MVPMKEKSTITKTFPAILAGLSGNLLGILNFKYNYYQSDG